MYRKGAGLVASTAAAVAVVVMFGVSLLDAPVGQRAIMTVFVFLAIVIAVGATAWITHSPAGIRLQQLIDIMTLRAAEIALVDSVSGWVYNPYPNRLAIDTMAVDSMYALLGAHEWVADNVNLFSTWVGVNDVCSVEGGWRVVFDVRGAKEWSTLTPVRILYDRLESHWYVIPFTDQPLGRSTREGECIVATMCPTQSDTALRTEAFHH
jgi:hypothetical protein